MVLKSSSCPNNKNSSGTPTLNIPYFLWTDDVLGSVVKTDVIKICKGEVKSDGCVGKENHHF
jgi:hypothetical protein